MSDIPNNIAETIIGQASKEAECRIETETAHDGTEVSVLVARAGVTATVIQDKLDAFAALPRSRAGTVRAFDVASFAALVLRDYDRGSVIFADVGAEGVKFEAVLDYHIPMSEHTDKAREGGQHGREVVLYDPNLSREWQAWTDQAGKSMSQGDFAAWIEDHLPDIADPRHLLDNPSCTAAKLGEVYGFTSANLWGYAEREKLASVSEGLSIREAAQVKNAVNTASGEVSFTYVTEHTDSDGRPLTVPKRFLLSIPVFEREAEYLVPVKLAYRKQAGSIVWTFELFRPDRFREDAIKGMVAGLKAALTPASTVADLAPAPVVPVHMAKRQTRPEK
jgi:uncharacterized protein YfdQ (DUF2303 family)